MAKRKRKLKKKIWLLLFILIALVSAGIFFFFTINNSLQESPKKEEQEEIIEEPEDIIEEYSLSFTAVGDALIHSSVYADAKVGNGYDFKPMFENVKPIFEKYDLAFYNQETILGGTEIGLSSYPCFNSPYEVGDAFMDMGFNLVSLATNHTLDRGRTAISNSLAYWGKQEGVIAAGSYVSEEVRTTPVILEKNGITYTLLAYTTVDNGLSISSNYSYMYNLYNAEKVKQDIERVRDKVDLLIVSMHWGTEYTHTPTTEQREIAQYLADLGVNIVVGHHPHVLQPIDFIGDTMVVYSLGNFISAQIGMERMIGLKADVTVKKTVTNGEAVITLEEPKAELVYTRLYRWYDANGNSYSKDFKIYTFGQLNDDILSGYKNYYDKYMKIATSYSDKVEAVGIE